MKQLFKFTSEDVHCNGRLKLIPDENGVYVPHELTAFPKGVYVKPGFELSADNEKKKKASKGESVQLCDLPEELQAELAIENRRKAYGRARNNLFDLLTCTLDFDCFVTLTCSPKEVDRHDYKEIVRRLGVWLDNRVRRNGLIYALVPELHKDGAVHFHGLMNFDKLKTVRAINPYNKCEMSDDKGRPIYNISDYTMGFTTVIPISGSNARIATALYCFKYITKSNGEKVGGRYYLSGGNLGRPKYEYIEVDYENMPDKEAVFAEGICRMKKHKFAKALERGNEIDSENS